MIIVPIAIDTSFIINKVLDQSFFLCGLKNYTIVLRTFLKYFRSNKRSNRKWGDMKTAERKRSPIEYSTSWVNEAGALRMMRRDS